MTYEEQIKEIRELVEWLAKYPSGEDALLALLEFGKSMKGVPMNLTNAKALAKLSEHMLLFHDHAVAKEIRKALAK